MFVNMCVKQRTYCVDLLLLALLATTTNTLALPCDNSLCNYEGVCEMQADGIAVCKCIGEEYFEGPHCTQAVDYCVLWEDPCQNGARCVSVLGTFLCEECPENYAGMDCSFEQANTFTKFYIHHNRLAIYGQPQKLMITVETVGSMPFRTELYTDNYMISLFITHDIHAPHDIQWTQSNNLHNVAKVLGLRHYEKLPYSRGYYHIETATFWSPGETTMTAIVTDKDISTSIVTNEYKLHVVLPPNVDCVPQLNFPLCWDPKNVMLVDIERYKKFEATIVNRCITKSTITYYWRIYSFGGNVEVKDLGPSKTRVLKVPPYSFWTMKDVNKLMFTLYVEATENGIKTAARCYIAILLKTVVPDIIGGLNREVNADETFEIDGSKSRNLMEPPNAPQNLNYRWDCSSETDTKNKFCHSAMSNANILRVPAHSLKPGQTYNFILTVNLQMDVSNTNVTVQIIKTVAGLPVHINIICIRNCRNGRFNSNEVINLEAKMLNVGMHKNSSYEWKSEQNSLSFGNRLVYFIPADVATLNLQLIIQNNNRFGIANMQLLRNSIPTGGSCVIEPTTGKEYITEFNITCSNFVDNDGDYPLTYEYITGNNFTLNRGTRSFLNMRLPKTTELKIKICDSFNGCAISTVTVEVTVMNVPQSVEVWQDFFNIKENNLQDVMENDKSENCLLLLYILSDKNYSLESAKIIWSQINQVKLDSIIDVEQMMYVSRNFITRLKPINDKSAKFIAKIMDTIYDGLKYVFADGEVREFSFDNYMDLTHQFTQTLYDFDKELDYIPLTGLHVISTAGDPNDPLGEQYIDNAIFDITILPRINNWLHLYKGLDKGLTFLGLLEAYMQWPGEPSLHVNIDTTFDLQAFSIDDSTNQTISIDIKNISVHLSPELLNTLQLDFGSNILLLQVLMMNSNPFWWYPEKTNLSTKVFFLSVFAPTQDEHSFLPLKKPITFDIKVMPEMHVKSFLINGTLQSSSYMSMYSVHLKRNCMLLVKLESTTAPLLIGLKLGSKPSGFQLRRANEIASTDTNFILVNDQGRGIKAFISILTSEWEIQAPVIYSFRAEIRQCLYFEFKLKDPQWTNRDGCVPTLIGQTADNIGCSCRHMSAYSAKILPALLKELKSVQLRVYLPINWKMVALFILFIIITLLFYAKACMDTIIYRKRFYFIQSEKDIHKMCNIKMLITTGNQSNAGTIANVTITLLTIDGPPKQFIIYQNPYSPWLKANNTFTIWLPLSSNDLVSPFKISLNLNDSYNSWYCRNIEIHDLKFKYAYRITVDKWIHSQQKIKLTIDAHSKTFNTSTSKTCKIAFIDIFSQWFLWQPIFGIWQSINTHTINVTRYERTCIWLVKFWVNICIVTYYFEETNLENYEEMRNDYFHLGIPGRKLIMLCLICYAAGFFLRFILLLLITRKDK